MGEKEQAQDSNRKISGGKDYFGDQRMVSRIKLKNILEKRM